MTYSYGHPNSPQPNDPRFETEDEAIQAAIAHQGEANWDSILAVWEDESGYICALIFEQWVYRP